MVAANMPAFERVIAELQDHTCRLVRLQGRAREVRDRREPSAGCAAPLKVHLPLAGGQAVAVPRTGHRLSCMARGRWGQA
ncbi:hypothetical protein LCGC14_2932870, partial [marine sediment metagenome]